MKLKKENLLRSKSIVVMGWPAFWNKNLNPYNNLLYTSILKRNVKVIEMSLMNILFMKYEILHLHWPEYYLGRKNLIESISKTIFLFLEIILSKLKGARVVWTVHNLKPHNNYHPRIFDLFKKIFPLFVNGFICLCPSSYEDALDNFPHLRNREYLIHEFGHGHYRDVYSNLVSNVDSRKSLGLPENCFVFLFFGSINQYKNVTELINAFLEISNQNDYLVIAGKPEVNYDQSFIKKASIIEPRIKPFLKYIDNEEIQLFMNSSDIVVLPFSEVLNSGSVLLALSFNKPVLVPKKGAIIDLENQLGDFWLQTYDGAFSPTHLLHAKNRLLHESKFSVDLSRLSWDLIADETVSFYKRLISG